MTRRTHDHADDRTRPALASQLAGTMFAPDTQPAPVTHRVEVRAHIRTIDGPPPPSGAQLRQEALQKHETDRIKQIAIRHVRSALVALWVERDRDAIRWPIAYVNADDVDRILRQWASCPRELHDLPGHWKGAIFQGPTWQKLVGQDRPSVRPHMHGTNLPSWAVRI